MSISVHGSLQKSISEPCLDAIEEGKFRSRIRLHGCWEGIVEIAAYAGWTDYILNAQAMDSEGRILNQTSTKRLGDWQNPNNYQSLYHDALDSYRNLWKSTKSKVG